MDDEDVERGAVRVQRQLGEAHADLLQISGEVRALVELLVDKGLLSAEEVEAKLAGAALPLDEKRRRRLYVINDDRQDKYGEQVNADVDCAARYHVCKAACCTFQVPLTEQDLEEGSARWDIARPFFLRKDPVDRRCVYQDRTTNGCGHYEARPLACRTYSCKLDTRIWRDFERMIPNDKGIAAILNQEDRRPLNLVAPSPTLPPLSKKP